jgi:hypothetical protein
MGKFVRPVHKYKYNIKVDPIVTVCEGIEKSAGTTIWKSLSVCGRITLVLT